MCAACTETPMWLVAYLTTPGPMFDSGLAQVICVVYKMSTGTGLSRNTSIFRCQYHSTSAPNSMSLVQLSEGQAGEAWESSN